MLQLCCRSMDLGVEVKLLDEPGSLRRPHEKQFELDGWIDTAPFEALLGMTIQSAADGRAELTMPFCLKLANGGGVMHGGALASLADTAVAMAIKSLLPPGTIFATTDLQMEFSAPVMAGQVRALASVEGPDGRTFAGRVELRGEEDQLYAVFRSTFRVARGQGFEDSP